MRFPEGLDIVVDMRPLCQRCRLLEGELTMPTDTGTSGPTAPNKTNVTVGDIRAGNVSLSDLTKGRQWEEIPVQQRRAMLELVATGTGATIKSVQSEKERADIASAQAYWQMLIPITGTAGTAARGALGGLIVTPRVPSIGVGVRNFAPQPKLQMRPDITLSGGRSGQIGNLCSVPNSVVKGSQGRVFVTDQQGRVIKDVTAARTKIVEHGPYGPKINKLERAPTAEELGWIEALWRIR
jgi:hypothetical protein